MIDFIKQLFDWFIPPIDHNETTQYFWRVRQAIFGCISFFGVMTISAALFGFVPHIEFARADDVKQQIHQVQVQISSAQAEAQSVAANVQRDLLADRAERIEGELLQLRVQHCTARKGAAKDLYWARISTLMVRYQQLTGRVYPLAQCSDL
jgi:hypothetical protein